MILGEFGMVVLRIYKCVLVRIFVEKALRTPQNIDHVARNLTKTLTGYPEHGLVTSGKTHQTTKYIVPYRVADPVYAF